MKPFKFLRQLEEHQFRFEIHGRDLELIYSMPQGEMDMHEEMSVVSMIEDTRETWRYYRNNIDRRVLDVIEETLADHLRGQSRVNFLND